jgi:hypothetical protein
MYQNRIVLIRKRSIRMPPVPWTIHPSVVATARPMTMCAQPPFGRVCNNGLRARVRSDIVCVRNSFLASVSKKLMMNAMKKSCYAILLGLLLFTFSCSNDDDNHDAMTCIDPEKIDEHALCPAVVDFVCGCDGNTYDNDCEATAHGVLKWTTGACQ